MVRNLELLEIPRIMWPYSVRGDVADKFFIKPPKQLHVFKRPAEDYIGE